MVATTMRADNTAALVRAAHHKHDLALERATDALRALDRAGEPITFHSVANAASVSRAWLYRQPALRAEIDELRQIQQRSPASALPLAQRASAESLQRRLEASTDEIRRLHEENARLRDQNARLLGERRSLPST
jgi:DNA anti-recombination protein RmuC